MILKHSGQVPASNVKKDGFKKMKARFILTADDGCPRYALRLMEIGSEGYTSFHCHEEEHEMFFVEGNGIVVDENKNENTITAGDALYIPPREYHQIKNCEKNILKIICTVPIFPGKTGKETTPCK